MPKRHDKLAVRRINPEIYNTWVYAGPYLRTGLWAQGGILKKSRLKFGIEKKGCPRERNLREIYTENNVGTEFSRYDATGARRS